MTSALAPMAWTFFQSVPPSRAGWLDIVNRMVIHGIDPMHGPPDVSDPWRIWPKTGWCHDYAVTKRYESDKRNRPHAISDRQNTNR
jgi:hypothetical protein